MHSAIPPILLIGPHPGDRLESIERYVQCLYRELGARTEVEILTPRSHFGRFGEFGPAGKWFDYVDKFILFTRSLRQRLAQRPALVHICDQGAAWITRCLTDTPHLLTCFDLLAIRAARGEFPGHRTRWSGRQLQKTILRGIEQAANITTISNATRGDLLRISSVSDDRIHSIPLGLDSSFKAMPGVESKQIISRFISPDVPFILHVGGNQWYKNRLGVLRVFRRIVDGEDPPLNLVLAGKPLDAGLTAELERLRLKDRVFFARGCDDRELRALYSSARLLLFPSLYEGFGWPILEAQACGCRVVTTGQEPMTDVGGSAAAYIDPADLDDAARVVRELLNESPVRTENRIQAGFENVRRFDISEMVSRYMALYSEIGAGLIPLCEGKGKARLAA